MIVASWAVKKFAYRTPSSATTDVGCRRFEPSCLETLTARTSDSDRPLLKGGACTCPLPAAPEPEPIDTGAQGQVDKLDASQ